jgi:ABC-2 type transport system permease protein
MRKHLRDFAWLLLAESYRMRSMWFWYLIMMAMNPLLNMFLLYIFGARANPQATLFVISGSLASGLTIATMLSLGQEVGGLKDSHAFEHYATLPISKLSYVLAIATRAMVFGLPSFLIVLGVGWAGLGLPLHLGPILIPAVLLASYSLVGFGAFIGFYSRTGQVAGMATQVLAGVMTSLAPVFVSIDQLPAILRATAAFMPTTYVATIMRGALSGVVDAQVWTSFAVLAVFTVVMLWLVVRKLDWRVGQG